MVIRIIVGSIVMLATAFIGLIKALQYEARVSELDNVIDAINVLETEIVYYQNTLPQALRRSSKRCKGVISRIYDDVADQIDNKEGESLEYIWESGVMSYINKMSLLDEDIEILADFGRELGLGNVDEQSKYFAYIKMLLTQQRKEAHSVMFKNGKLSKQLGVLLGVTLFIIII